MEQAYAILIAMFNALVTLAIVVFAMATAYLGHRVIHGIRVYTQFRGTRLVTCPEMGVHSVLDEPCLQLSECSRWPMREGCGQDCLRQVEARESELRFISRLKHSPYCTCARNQE